MIYRVDEFTEDSINTATDNKYNNSWLVLTLSKDIYGNTYHELQAWNLKGTSDFIVTFPEHDRNRLRAVVGKHDFKDIERMTSRKSVEIGKTKQKSLPYVLVDIYNKRLSKHKQLNPLVLSV